MNSTIAPHRFTNALAVPMVAAGVLVSGAAALSTAYDGSGVCITALPNSGDANLGLVTLSLNPATPARNLADAATPAASYSTSQ